MASPLRPRQNGRCTSCLPRVVHQDLLSQEARSRPLRACPQGHQGEWTLTSFPPRMYPGQSRDQIAPTTDPDLMRPTAVTASTAQMRHRPDCSPRLQPAPLLGRPAPLQRAAPEAPAARVPAPSQPSHLSRLCPKPGGARVLFSRLSCLLTFPGMLLLPWTTGGLHRGRPSPRRWHPRPQAGLGQREALPGRTRCSPLRAQRDGQHTASSLLSPPAPNARVEGPAPEQTTWASCWKSSRCGTCCSVCSSGMVSLCRPYRSCTSWRRCHLAGACRAGPHPSSLRVEHRGLLPVQATEAVHPVHIPDLRSPVQGSALTSRTSWKVPSSQQPQGVVHAVPC